MLYWSLFDPLCWLAMVNDKRTWKARHLSAGCCHSEPVHITNELRWMSFYLPGCGEPDLQTRASRRRLYLDLPVCSAGCASRVLKSGMNCNLKTKERWRDWTTKYFSHQVTLVTKNTLIWFKQNCDLCFGPFDIFLWIGTWMVLLKVRYSSEIVLYSGRFVLIVADSF